MYRCSDCGTFNLIDDVELSPSCSSCSRELDVSGAPQEVSAEGYTRALASSPMPVVVDFGVKWAPPCQAVEPVIEHFARKHAGKVLVLKVNGDKSPKLFASLGIKAVPTFQAFEQGIEVARHGGVLRQDAFDRWADRAFSRAAA